MAGRVNNNLTVYWQNTANPSLGGKGVYKTYTRVVIPAEALVSNLSLISGNQTEKFDYEIEEKPGQKSIGFLLIVSPGETRGVSLNWEEESIVNFDEKGQYRLFWRKQAGTEADPITVQVKLPRDKIITTGRDFSLTNEGYYLYNTTLVSDFFATLNWK